MEEWLTQNDVNDRGLDNIELNAELEVVDDKWYIGREAQNNKVNAC
jgi:hypothetical protein